MPRNAPFRTLWAIFGYISLNTWFWSAIFHTRDTPFTERMDYFSAFLLVLGQFNSFVVRFLKLRRNLNWLMYLVNVGSLFYFMYHCNYLSSIKFDYGYNMRTNIFVGILNSFCWLSWCAYKIFIKKNKYIWRCALSVFDFRPIWWFLDSHALWHFSTIILPYYWYNFIVDDNYYLKNLIKFLNEYLSRLCLSKKIPKKKVDEKHQIQKIRY
ncbi:Post-GPI attachment to s factor 3 [Brachionus plicatilis]|uniref:Post-GPI attachment to proteins factor 3 n=1 Tax=Brachionus plicatilis TaxID=10195 RepID=A0A3M7P141_BRAPC|nr:Post-GPI attachment to s factor 3 [Brachionus plicatilis]